MAWNWFSGGSPKDGPLVRRARVEPAAMKAATIQAQKRGASHVQHLEISGGKPVPAPYAGNG
jgi:hypothetical protein